MNEPLNIRDYQIHLPPLGEGAFGRVYRATYRGISERALKIFRTPSVNLSQMARELEKLSSVAEHAGIVTLHDFDLLSDPPYYAMGLHADQVDDAWQTRTLDRLCGHVDHREAWRLLRNIADALAYLHRHHIIHCDIKPSNILLTDEIPPSVKICDFGQSRTDFDEVELGGTPLYASPEQLRRPRESSDGRGFRWDVYSFGVVAFKLVTGQLPRLRKYSELERQSFDPEASIVEDSGDPDPAAPRRFDAERLASMIEEESEIVWPSGCRLAYTYRAIIERCLELSPKDRFTDMREVLLAMQAGDHYRQARRARRLNLLFSLLLAAALWASGSALLQASRARKASQEAQKAREQAEELVHFIVYRLNREDISSPGKDELFDHIAENAETYLSNLPAADDRSVTLMRLTANTAALRARQAFDKGEYDLALAKFQKAYEIRANLVQKAPDLQDLAVAAEANLLDIARAYEKLGDPFDAAKTYEKALELRTKNLDLTQPLPRQALSQVTECVLPLAHVLQENGKPDEALTRLTELSSLHRLSLTAAPSNEIGGATQSFISVLQALANLQVEQSQPAESAKTFSEILDLSENLKNSPVSVRLAAEAAEANSLRSLGMIYLSQEKTDSAMAAFRDELPLRQLTVDRNPGEPEARIALAEVYANIASCFDLTQTSTRSVALAHLEHAVDEIGMLPSSSREKQENQQRLINLHNRISRILEMDE